MMSRMSRRKFVAAVGVIAAAQALSRYAHAQAFQSRPVKIVVPAAAGGALDLISRVLAERVADQFKHGIYVENRPGANWIIGMDAVAKSQPDGHTLLLVSTSGFSINPHLFKNVPPMEEFVPITTATKGAFVVLVNPKLGVESVPDFIKLLKASPGKYNHASNSATTKLLSEFFKSQAGVEYADVSYRGASLAISDTMIGVTDFCFVDFGSATNVLQDRSLIALAVTSAERYELNPDIPTLSEAALPGFSVDGGTVLFAPARISPEVLTQLNAIFMNVLRSPEVIARFRTIGQIAKGSATEETLRSLRLEVDRWATLIREKNITFK